MSAPTTRLHYNTRTAGPWRRSRSHMSSQTKLTSADTRPDQYYSRERAVLVVYIEGELVPTIAMFKDQMKRHGPGEEVKMQIQRYLGLPVAGVVYFRPTLATMTDEIAQHPRYIKPSSAQRHFLWRDLYEPLSHGEHVVAQWLFDGFRRLGFTPATPHVGPLLPDEAEDVKQNQRNFGKLWHRTSAHASRRWKVGTARRCELDLRPLVPTVHCSRVYVSPLAQAGSLLRFRCETTDSQAPAVRDILGRVATALPFSPELASGHLRNGLPFVDVLVSLYTLFAGASRPEEQENALFAQVVPLVDALSSADV